MLSALPSFAPPNTLGDVIAPGASNRPTHAERYRVNCAGACAPPCALSKLPLIKLYSTSAVQMHRAPPAGVMLPVFDTHMRGIARFDRINPYTSLTRGHHALNWKFSRLAQREPGSGREQRTQRVLLYLVLSLLVSSQLLHR